MKKKVKRKKATKRKTKREQKTLMPKDERNKKTGRVEAYTFGEAQRKKGFPW